MLTTRFVLSSITIAVVAASLLVGADKQFHPGPASSYAHQGSDNVMVGARAYDKPDDIEAAFGKKIDFQRYGLTAVLVVIENNRKHTLDLRSMEVNIVAADGKHFPPMKASEVQLLARNGKRPPQVPLSVPLPKKKASITGPEIESHAFITEMLAPNDTASGFFYFNGTVEHGDKLYISGMQETPSGRDITYFEFPFEE
jgi:hypothetical protein